MQLTCHEIDYSLRSYSHQPQSKELWPIWQGGKGQRVRAEEKAVCHAWSNHSPPQIIGHPKSREILMFVCLQKDAKQCCDGTNVDRAHWHEFHETCHSGTLTVLVNSHQR